MTIEPLAVIRLNHVEFELWLTHVRSIFADGSEVNAAPNGDETIIETALHELLHHVYAQVTTNTPSACLKAVAVGDGVRWTPERKQEENFAFPAGKVLYPALKTIFGTYNKRD